MTEICTTCHGLGLDFSDEPCPACKGFKVVIRNEQTCPRCGGSRKEPDSTVYSCSMCKGSGWIPSEPYQGLDEVPAVLVVDTTPLRKALDQVLQNKYEDTFAFGFVGGLMVNAVEELEGESLVSKQKWIDTLLKKGTILIDYDSIFQVVDGVGARIYQFEYKGKS